MARYIKSLQIKFLCNQHSAEIHRCTLGYIDIFNNQIKGGPQYVVSAIFFVKNQWRQGWDCKSTVFCQFQKCKFIAVAHTYEVSLKLWISMANVQFPCRGLVVDWQKHYKISGFMDVAC